MLSACGYLWLVLGGCEYFWLVWDGYIWLVWDGYTWFWVVIDGFDWFWLVWVFVASVGWFWQVLLIYIPVLSFSGCLVCVCVCVCVCVFCLFTSFLSVLFVFHRKNLVLYHVIYDFYRWIISEKKRCCGK